MKLCFFLIFVEQGSAVVPPEIAKYVVPKGAIISNFGTGNKILRSKKYGFFLQKNEKINYHPAQAYKFSLKHNALEKTFAYVQLNTSNKPLLLY